MKEKEQQKIKLSRLRKIVKDTENLSDDKEITFEELLLLTFPDIYKSVQRFYTDAYTAGYIQGRNEKNEN